MLWIAGIDEVGVGALAGPMIAVAVAFPVPESYAMNVRDMLPAGKFWPLARVKDSKKFSSKRVRSEAEAELGDYLLSVGAEVGVGIATAEEINERSHATAYSRIMADAAAMATLDKGITPEMLIVDGAHMIAYNGPQRAEKKADARFFHVAAASVIAKVWRDRLMEELDDEHPGYGWSRGNGYGTPEHIEALMDIGFTRHHRKKACLTAKRNFRRKNKYK